MSYKYSSIGLKASDYRPAGQLAIYDHIITRLRDKLPRIRYLFGDDATHHNYVDITYALEYPDVLIDLPFVAISFISELSGNVGFGQIPAGVDAGEFEGINKKMLLQIDVWGRNSMERDMIADAVMNVMNKSRHYFASLGFRDVFPDLGQTRMFEQQRDTIYPRVSQTTSRIWRKVITYHVEYDLIWTPDKEDPEGLIEQVNINMNDVNTQIGQATEWPLDSQLLDSLEDPIW